MAFDYKKEYKDLYMPKCAPVQADVPAMGYFCVRGKGNPNTCEHLGIYRSLYSFL